MEPLREPILREIRCPSRLRHRADNMARPGNRMALRHRATAPLASLTALRLKAGSTALQEHGRHRREGKRLTAHLRSRTHPV